MSEIQVLIAAYGPTALEEIAARPHAETEGVEYLVGWQNGAEGHVPESLRTRDDFKIFHEPTTGLCNNRNGLLQRATADIVVISDDDLAYSARHLQSLREAFETFPDCHILTFRYTSDNFPKKYPDHTFDLRKPPKGYFVTSMEIALNLGRIREDFGDTGMVRFNPDFGVNGNLFCCGEEDLFIRELLDRGFKGRFVPSDICVNTDSTTSERIGSTRPFIETKGAVMRTLYPGSWFPRMLVHAWRARKGPQSVPFFRYCRWWLAGARKASRIQIFRRK